MLIFVTALLPCRHTFVDWSQASTAQPSNTSNCLCTTISGRSTHWLPHADWSNDIPHTWCQSASADVTRLMSAAGVTSCVFKCWCVQAWTEALEVDAEARDEDNAEAAGVSINISAHENKKWASESRPLPLGCTLLLLRALNCCLRRPLRAHCCCCSLCLRCPSGTHCCSALNYAWLCLLSIMLASGAC